MLEDGGKSVPLHQSLQRLHVLGIGARCPDPFSSKPSKSREGKPRAACQLWVTRWLRSKRRRCRARGAMAPGTADSSGSQPPPTPRVAQRLSREPELRHVTPAAPSTAGAGPEGFPVPPSAFLPWGWTCNPDTRRRTELPPDPQLLKLLPCDNACLSTGDRALPQHRHSRWPRSF